MNCGISNHYDLTYGHSNTTIDDYKYVNKSAYNTGDFQVSGKSCQHLEKTTKPSCTQIKADLKSSFRDYF